MAESENNFSARKNGVDTLVHADRRETMRAMDPSSARRISRAERMVVRRLLSSVELGHAAQLQTKEATLMNVSECWQTLLETEKKCGVKSDSTCGK